MLNSKPLELVSKAKLSSVLILDNDGYPIASGSVVEVSKRKWCIITNKHVLNINRPIQICLNFLTGAQCFEATILTSHPTLDLVAIVPIKHQLPPFPLVNMILRKAFASKEEIKEGLPIFHIGYPLGLGAEEYNYPLVRRGIVAQVMPKHSDFLIDSVASPGNSGSGVFSATEGKFFGIISGYLKDFSYFSDDGALLGTPVQVNSGLAIVISAPSVKKMFSDYVLKRIRSRLKKVKKAL